MSVKTFRQFSISLLVAVLIGCTKQEFKLPLGNVEAGRANFILLQCDQCHSVEGIQVNQDQLMNVRLGGKTTRVKSYADLVTSIIYPSHVLSRGANPETMTEDGMSKMRNYNDQMTVEELIDLVTFLESKYEIWVPPHYTITPP